MTKLPELDMRPSLQLACGFTIAAASALSSVRTVGIVGAGPAGLSLAVALERTGDYDVTIFDRADSLRPALGGGVQLNSGAAVLARMDEELGAALATIGQPVRRVRSRTVNGDSLLDLDLATAIREDARAREAGLVDADEGVRAYTIMRDALQKTLRGALARTRMARARVVDVEGRSVVGAEVVLEGGERRAFDLVAGCDGVRGVSRGARRAPTEPLAVLGKRTRIRWGVASAPSRGARDELHQWFGPGGTYCLAGSYGGAGGAAFDQCVVVSPESGDGGGDGWERSSAVTRDAMVERLSAAGMPADVVALARACDRCFELDADYVNPLPTWRSGGASVLLGDAAHAMPPFLGQGTNQAVQDAYCLAAKLKTLNAGGFDSLDAALASYEADRKFAVVRLGVNSVVLGAVETLAPEWARDSFFRATGALGVARTVFLDGATPKV